jgi:hypothetical protein
MAIHMTWLPDHELLAMGFERFRAFCLSHGMLPAAVEKYWANIQSDRGGLGLSRSGTKGESDHQRVLTLIEEIKAARPWSSTLQETLEDAERIEKSYRRGFLISEGETAALDSLERVLGKKPCIEGRGGA